MLARSNGFTFWTLERVPLLNFPQHVAAGSVHASGSLSSSTYTSSVFKSYPSPKLRGLRLLHGHSPSHGRIYFRCILGGLGRVAPNSRTRHRCFSFTPDCRFFHHFFHRIGIYSTVLGYPFHTTDSTAIPTDELSRLQNLTSSPGAGKMCNLRQQTTTTLTSQSAVLYPYRVTREGEHLGKRQHVAELPAVKLNALRKKRVFNIRSFTPCVPSFLRGILRGLLGISGIHVH